MIQAAEAGGGGGCGSAAPDRRAGAALPHPLPPISAVETLRLGAQLLAKAGVGDLDQGLGALALGLALEAGDAVLGDNEVGEGARHGDRLALGHERADA